MDTAAIVRELWDREMIRECKARYCHLLDSRRFAELVDTCFARTGTVVDFTPEHRRVEGFDNVRDFYAVYVPSIREQTAHRITNGVIRIDGGRALASWYLQGSLTIAGTPYLVQGVYNDEFVIEDGVWKIRVLDLDWEYLCPAAEGWVAPRTTPAIAWTRKRPGRALGLPT